MPRGVSIYNGDNDEIEASVVPVEKIDGVTADRDSRSPLEKVTASMTTNDKSENRLAMAVEFDHMYIGCSETKASIGKDIEVQHLKDLLLLHLDLIQQQAEQLVAKDKLIKSLRDENENLKSKLDRIDRRVSLSLGKKSNESTSIEPKTEPVVEEVQEDTTHSAKRLGSPTSKAESQATKTQSPSSKNASCSKSPSSKPASPASKPGSPTNKSVSPQSKSGTPQSKSASPQSKPGSPQSKPLSPQSKPLSPQSKPVSPQSKPGSPQIKPVLPQSKPGSPQSKPGSPQSKPGSPQSKPGSPQSKPGSPQSKPGSPVSKSLTITSKTISPTSKSVSPNSKSGSPNKSTLHSKVGVINSKSVSPQPRVGSPNKVASPPNRTSSPTSKSLTVSNKSSSPPHVKASSPQPKIATSQNNAESPSCKTESPCSIELSSNKTGSTAKSGKRPSPRWASPKTSLRERRQRNTSQSQSSENDGEAELLKELPKSSNERERSRLKRRSDSETELSPVKRIRPERERSSHVKDDGLTDHNLRSRDKSKDRAKGNQDESPGSPVEHPATPTLRAAALEAKKLRQKLQLKGKTPVGNSVRAEGILNTTVSYFLPYGTLIHDPNPEEECLQAQVEIPRWGTRMLTSLYVMEGTENLEDEIFIKRHAKPEQDEKRRKRWDLQRMREQRHYERLRERYESRQSANEPTVSGHGSLWPFPESAMYLHVEDTLPVCAFGQPLARIPPQEFAIPWLTGQCLEGVSTRRRKR